MGEAVYPAGPQLLPALASALQGTGHALSKPWRRGGHRPWGLAIKEGQRLRWDFKDLLVSINLLHSSWMLLIVSFPGVCDKAFPWRLKIQEINYYTKFSRECSCLGSKRKGSCWGRYWSPSSPGRVLPALNDIGSRLLWPTSLKQKWLNGLKHGSVISEMREERAISACDTLGLVPDLCKSLLLNTKRSLWEDRKSSNYICTLFLLLKQWTKTLEEIPPDWQIVRLEWESDKTGSSYSLFACFLFVIIMLTLKICFLNGILIIEILSCELDSFLGKKKIVAH